MSAYLNIGYVMIGRLFGKKTFQYKCHECGKIHEGSPSFSFKYPIYYFDVPEDEREKRISISDDLCQIEPSLDDADGAIIYCIRVILEIPIKGSNEPFTWGVWVTQSKDSFEQYVATFSEDQSAQQSFGWLAVNMPFYNESAINAPLVNLECEVHLGSLGQRPKVVLWENTHSLAVDQRDGISWEKASRIANLTNSQFLGQ